MSYNAWEVWAANVKFDDSPQIKPRPVLILDDQTAVIICLKLTGSAPRQGEYILQEWALAGLQKQTTVRINKVLRMVPNDLKYKIGDLSPLDIANIQAQLLRSTK